MPELEFVGQSARDKDNIAANPSRLLNLYREPVVPGGVTGYVLRAVPGLESFGDVPGVFTRAMGTVNGNLFVLSNGRLYEVSTAGSVTDRGATADSEAASIAGNNGKVTACIGGRYFVWNGTTLTEPTPGAFSAFGSVEYLSNYTILTEQGGRRFQWSAVADPTTLPGLSFSTADGRDDNLIRAIAINGQLYLFKERSHEVWYVTGQAGASAFRRQVGGVGEVGLRGFGLITKVEGSAFLVGDDGRAYIVGNGLMPVSTPPVEVAIEGCVPEACLTYAVRGHTFCAIVFRDCPAWVYDIATGEWHERGSGTGAWNVSGAEEFADDWIVSRDGGGLFRLGTYNADADEPLIRRAVSRPLRIDGQRFMVREIEMFPRVGFADASIELRLSRDGGVTWGEPKKRSWSVGEYDKRIIWRAQGQARSLVAEITVSDPKAVPINATARVAV